MSSIKEGWKKLKSGLFGKDASEPSPDIVEVNVGAAEDSDRKLTLKMNTLEKFMDTENVLAALRNGDKIVLVKIRPLREKDMTELKRAINRLKTHCAATGGEMAAIDDNWLIMVPPCVSIEKA